MAAFFLVCENASRVFHLTETSTPNREALGDTVPDGGDMESKQP